MLKKYKIGNGSIINTYATVSKIDYTNDTFTLGKILDNHIYINMNDSDIVYGLGESVRGTNKRGWIYTSFTSDDPNHEETKESLYGAHNFILIDGERKLGLFFDTPSKITFDIGYTDTSMIIIYMDELNCDLYEITADKSIDVVKEFRRLCGKSYMAPLWAFGYQQSRWSYPTKSDVLHVIDNYNRLQIPLECVYLDIDYMQNYKDFTIDSDKFPNIKEFVLECKKDNIHLIPIIDAGVKIEDGYDIYTEGIEGNYFVTYKDGMPFEAAVWPGLCHFPDFLNQDAREWFGMKYKALTDLGFDGFWNDMNEPALFYTPSGIKKAVDYIATKKDKKNLDLSECFSLKDAINSLANNMDDYKSMYHNVNGVRVRHDLVHNLYGYNMTRSAAEALDKLREERTLLFSRSSYIGMHRYGGIWTGDNKSWWSHLELNIKQMPNINMAGFLYSGADLGGFSCNTTEDLMLRWLEFSLFTPLMRNHSALGTKQQELYKFNRIDDIRNIVNLRYSFIPYLYSEYMKAIKNDDIIFKPLSFKYPNDLLAREVEDELLVGESIMIAPIYKANTTGRYVYLPEDMKMIRFRAFNDYDIEALDSGHHYVSCKLNEVLVFILPGKIFPITLPQNRVEDLNMRVLHIFNYGVNTSYDYYLDDGVSKNFNGKIITIKKTNKLIDDNDDLILA